MEQELEAVRQELVAANARIVSLESALAVSNGAAASLLPNLRCCCRHHGGVSSRKYVAATAALMGVVVFFFATYGTFGLWDARHAAAEERYHAGKARRKALDAAFRARANSTAGHRVPLHVELVSATPRIWRIPNFISDAEADFIVDAYENLPFPFTYVGGGGRVCDDFTFGYFERAHNRVLAAVVDRMEQIVAAYQKPRSIGADSLLPELQLVRYTAAQGGGRFTGHFDQESNCMPATMMVYLVDIPKDAGGETEFPRARPRPIRIAPKRGDLVLWSTCASTETLAAQAVQRSAASAVGTGHDIDCVFDDVEGAEEICLPTEKSDEITCIVNHGEERGAHEQICYPSEKDIDATTLHAGLAITKQGVEKWILNRFFTQSDGFEWRGEFEPNFPKSITYAL